MNPNCPKVLLLVTPPRVGAPKNDNPLRLETAFRTAGCRVTVAPHEAVLSLPLSPFDLIWPVGFGPLAGYPARLKAMAQHARSLFVSAPEAVGQLHSKDKWLRYAPETHVADDPRILIEFADRGGQWVLKPNVGSYGRHVVRVSASRDIAKLMNAHPGTWLLQRYVPEIVQGEYRTLTAGGAIIGTYLRKPADGFHANLSQRSEAAAATLPNDHASILARTVDTLNPHSIRFAAVDTCGGHLMEVNVANPGGMATLDQLYGGNSAERVVDSILNADPTDPWP